MSGTEFQNLVFGTLEGVVVGVVAVLALLAGFIVLLGLPKLRPSGRRTRTVRSLDEAQGAGQAYLTPDQPRGIIDQLRTPELLEAAARKTG
jgi:hypothetical protein